MLSDQHLQTARNGSASRLSGTHTCQPTTLLYCCQSQTMVGGFVRCSAELLTAACSQGGGEVPQQRRGFVIRCYDDRCHECITQLPSSRSQQTILDIVPGSRRRHEVTSAQAGADSPARALVSPQPALQSPDHQHRSVPIRMVHSHVLHPSGVL